MKKHFNVICNLMQRVYSVYFVHYIAFSILISTQNRLAEFKRHYNRFNNKLEVCFLLRQLIERELVGLQCIQERLTCH